jgi:BolA protein
MSTSTEATRQLVVEALERTLEPTDLEVIDHSEAHAGHAGNEAQAGHYIIRITSAAFEGLSLLEQHRKVFDAVGYPMDGRIHALEIKTHTP